MSLLLMAHSIVRWLIVAVAVLVAVRFTLGWQRGTPFEKLDASLAAGFGGLMDLQALLGIGFFLWSGFAQNYFPAYRFAHAAAMLVAVVVAHLSARWKAAADKIRYRNTLFTVLGALAIVVVGVFLLPQGWFK